MQHLGHYLTSASMRTLSFVAVLALTAQVFAFETANSTATAAAPAWPKPWALVLVKTGNSIQAAPLSESTAKSDSYTDYSDAQAELMHQAHALIGPEYLMYVQSSYDDSVPVLREVAMPTQYFNTASEAIHAADPDPASITWIQLIYAKDGLTAQELNAIRDDYHHHEKKDQKPATRLFEILDANLNVGRRGHVTYGCGDVWQNGLTRQELACSDNKTYIRCQLEQYIKYRATRTTFTVGPCAK